MPLPALRLNLPFLPFPSQLEPTRGPSRPRPLWPPPTCPAVASLTSLPGLLLPRRRAGSAPPTPPCSGPVDVLLPAPGAPLGAVPAESAPPAGTPSGPAASVPGRRRTTFLPFRGLLFTPPSRVPRVIIWLPFCPSHGPVCVTRSDHVVLCSATPAPCLARRGHPITISLTNRKAIETIKIFILIRNESPDAKPRNLEFFFCRLQGAVEGF